MALDIPNFKEIFKQRDVRETAAGGISQTNFNADDFLVSSGVVNLKNKTSYWSCPGCSFIPEETDVNDVQIDANQFGILHNINFNGICSVGVNLPQGAVVTKAIVYGNFVGTNWNLFRKHLSEQDGTELMATAAIASDDSTITGGTVDNDFYCYFFDVPTVAGNQIYGAKVEYTTDYD